MRLLPDCREVTRLVLQAEEAPLSPRQRLTLRLHWMICENCSRFRDQARTMRLAVDRWRRYREE